MMECAEATCTTCEPGAEQSALCVSVCPYRHFIVGGNKSAALGGAAGRLGSEGCGGIRGPSGIAGFDPLLEDSAGAAFSQPPRPQGDDQPPQQGVSQVPCLLASHAILPLLLCLAGMSQTQQELLRRNTALRSNATFLEPG